MKTKHSLLFLLVPFLLVVSGTSHSQFLRAGGNSQVVTPAGNDSDTAEGDWQVASDGTVVSRATSSVAGGSSASMSFTAGFGLLRSSLRADVAGAGELWASAGGTFNSFRNFVGASFFDTITLTGPGPVSLLISTSLHSVNGAPDEFTYADVQMKVDVFPSFAPRVNLSPMMHIGSGNTTSNLSFTLNGTGGQTFDLLAELSSLVTARMPAGSLGERSAFADASHTGLVTITALSGSFTSASGALYSAPAPVPEPKTDFLMLLGLVASGVWIRGRMRRAPAR